MKGVGPLLVLLLVAGGCGSDAAKDSSRTNATDAPPAADEGGATAVWEVDPNDPPTARASSFTALVTRLECSGGKTGAVRRPHVVVEPDRVVVTFTADPLPPGHYTCPGNDAVPYAVELGEPIGGRNVVDGACLAGQATSTSFCIEGSVRWHP